MITRTYRACTLPSTLRLLYASVVGAAAMLRTAGKTITTIRSSLHPTKISTRRHFVSFVTLQPLNPYTPRLRGLCVTGTPSSRGVKRRHKFLCSRGGSVSVLSRSASATGASAAAASELIATVKGETEAEETTKKSRFIGRCGPAATFEEAKALLGRVHKEHPKARHSCWAWKGLGEEHRFSDDGEPGGTAGQPILGAIESEGVSEVMVVVTRYFGGIKLGTGGLCRAYSSGARLCLQAAETETRTPVLQLSVSAPLDNLGGVYHAVSDCQRLSEEFTTDGSVVLRIAVELGQVDEVRRRLQDATKGVAEIAEG